MPRTTDLDNITQELDDVTGGCRACYWHGAGPWGYPPPRYAYGPRYWGGWGGPPPGAYYPPPRRAYWRYW